MATNYRVLSVTSLLLKSNEEYKDIAVQQDMNISEREQERELTAEAKRVTEEDTLGN